MALEIADLGAATSLIDRHLATIGPQSENPFELEPVPLDAWLAGPYYINLGFQPSPLQMLALRHMEWVYLPETWEALGWIRDDVDQVNFLVLKWGKGSGKDTISQVGLLRIIYLLQCLKCPQAYYGIGLHSPIHLTNIAASSTQANAVFYRPLRDLIKASPFFKDQVDGKPGMLKMTFAKSGIATRGGGYR